MNAVTDKYLTSAAKRGAWRGRRDTLFSKFEKTDTPELALAITI